ncbi:uncharacterized protein EV420DRAFT_1560826 [Desarmillaria tabescens]|uniref:Uncharacterized protein n=1 Tax=Armillaria tabescens TaxID=1929756 RepID=A0AA39JYY4_ARMTA|nr:uncharacterized protein EV420DRAFT_1560826 [Desarmillaria tabescens]KAK0451409.1 hypothetical protein EV420DRAFT_1560826 [Desarmillaria tabescens]
MAVLIFLATPPSPNPFMDPFTPPKPLPKKRYHSKQYRDRHSRKRDVSEHCRPLRLDDLERRPPSPSPEGGDDLASNRVIKPLTWITGRTPYSRGTASLHVCDPAKKTGPTDGYLQEDLRHRLFVNFDIFLQTFLNVPADWRTTYKSAIDDVLADQHFDRLLNEYLKKANSTSIDHNREKRLYLPYVKMCNRAVDVLQTNELTAVPDDDIVHYYRLDPHVVKGSRDQLKPDMIGVMTRIFASAEGKLKRDALKKFAEDRELDTKKGDIEGQGPMQKTLKPDNIPSWSHCTHIKEMKATDRALDDRTKAIRLLSKDGQVPLKSFPRKRWVENGQLDKQAADIPLMPGNPSRIKKQWSDNRDKEMKGTDNILNEGDSRNTLFTNGGQEALTVVPHESCAVGDSLSEEDDGLSAATDQPRIATRTSVDNTLGGQRRNDRARSELR